MTDGPHDGVHFGPDHVVRRIFLRTRHGTKHGAKTPPHQRKRPDMIARMARTKRGKKTLH